MPWQASLASLARGFFVSGGEIVERYEPAHDRGEVAAGLGRRARVRRAEPRAGHGRTTRRKTYVLEMLPYPSRRAAHGARAQLHARRRRHALPPAPAAAHVLRPMGFDAFGLPAENAAIREGGHPRVGHRAQHRDDPRARWSAWAGRSTGRARLSTHEPEYYRWTQWLFLRFFERGLAYRKEAPVNWCPNDQTVLANEQVIDGRCERCGAEVEAKSLDAVVLPHHRRTRTRCSTRWSCSSRGPSAC